MRSALVQVPKALRRIIRVVPHADAGGDGGDGDGNTRTGFVGGKGGSVFIRIRVRGTEERGPLLSVVQPLRGERGQVRPHGAKFHEHLRRRGITHERDSGEEALGSGHGGATHARAPNWHRPSGLKEPSELLQAVVETTVTGTAHLHPAAARGTRHLPRINGGASRSSESEHGRRGGYGERV